MFGILFCLDLELFAKIKKNLVSADTQKPGFLHFLWITQDLNKIKKKVEHPFEDIMLSSSFYSYLYKFPRVKFGDDLLVVSTFF